MYENSLINLAYKYAISKHGLQKRKTGEYYTEHPKRVASYVFLHKGSSYRIEELMIIALLHDVLEDTPATAKEIEELFGYDVAQTVLELTTVKKEMDESNLEKKEFLGRKMASMTEYALVVKLCDRLDNIRSLHGTDDKFKYRQLKDTEYIIDYLYKNRTFLTRTHHILLIEIKKSMDAYNPQKQNEESGVKHE